MAIHPGWDLGGIALTRNSSPILEYSPYIQNRQIVILELKFYKIKVDLVN